MTPTTPQRIYVTQYEESRDCGGCLWDNTLFYRVGKEAVGNPDWTDEDRARFGNGLCADCFADMLWEEGCTIIWAGEKPTEVEHVD